MTQREEERFCLDVADRCQYQNYHSKLVCKYSTYHRDENPSGPEKMYSSYKQKLSGARARQYCSVTRIRLNVQL